MGTVYNRGTRDKPNWWGKFKDASGTWKAVPTNKPTKQQARVWIEERESNVADGKPAIEQPKDEKTFEQAADYWLTNHSAAACVSHDDNTGRMKHLRKAFGKLPLSHITPQRIDEFKAGRVAETKVDPENPKKQVPRWAVGTVNRMLSLLRKLLNDSVRWGYITHAPKVKLLPAPETDFDYLHRDEAERFLSWSRENAPQDFPLYATAIYTGARMGELYGLMWSDIDLDRGLITYRRSYEQQFTKSKKVRRVRINKQLSIVLKSWRNVCPKGELDLVFPKPDGLARARERPPIHFEDHLAGARCHAITFHDLRHTAASLMVMAGISLRSVQQMLGHSTILVTERYAHLAPDFMEREADKLALDTGGFGQLVVLEGGQTPG
jgi:integrase